MQEFQKCVKKPEGVETQLPKTPDKCREFALNILSFFKEMSQSEKDEYLKAWNKFDGKQPVAQRMSDNWDFYRQFVQNTVVGMEEVKKCLTIIGIYLTNSYVSGIHIKMSQFNHSCKSNAFRHQEGRLIAYKNIKAGQEITFHRFGDFGSSWIFVLNRTKRQQEFHRHST